MKKRKSINDYREEVIGKTFNWVTITNVIPNPNGGHMLGIGICKCGNIVSTELKKLINGHTKSCGCYNKSKEKAEKHIQWYKDNPDRRDEMIEKVKRWRSDNPDRLADISCKISNWYMNHPEFLVSSKQEIEIGQFVDTIYSGQCIRNSRNIISPHELDFYYPDKNIAIEYNGNFWHNTDHRSNDYHIIKYRKCKECGILLVSIFEQEWKYNNDAVKSYLIDLFNDRENIISFNKPLYMNNNYPSPHTVTSDNIIDDYYITNKGDKVFTCGYSLLL